MGGNNSRERKGSLALFNTINEKEYLFIAMQADVDKAFVTRDRKSIETLFAEITGHILELKQIRKSDLSPSDRGRIEKLVYSFEISLAKLKSVYGYLTLPKKTTANSVFYNETVNDFNNVDSDENHFRPRSSLPNSFDSALSVAQTISRANSLYNRPPFPDSSLLDLDLSLGFALSTIESEFESLKMVASEPIDDVTQYYQLDKTVFYLCAQLNQLHCSAEPKLETKKLELLAELKRFRELLDRRAAELEEMLRIGTDLRALEIRFDGCSIADYQSLLDEVLKLQEKLDNTSWEDNLQPKKLAALENVEGLIAKISYAESEQVVDESFQQIYGNVEASYKAGGGGASTDFTYDIINNLSAVKSGPSYSRATIYSNVAIVRENEDGTRSYNGANTPKKPPLPLPRNYDEKVINDLPKHWRRLNEIFDKKVMTAGDASEVDEIQRHLEVAKNLFMRKIGKVNERCQEVVDL
ncbi:uncharacterized protein LOC132699160 [Cylas formicarius]|uniref:uncharacterized protein LOC132699160 n=1 Tax=Cylas formicarius TaxID=197179 RepID=UPI00295856CE|nr:uncharacterized protein LOC132699160 [Cylas formicarius]